MSIAATRLVWEHSSATGSALVVLLALADHADDAFEAWPSQATLARLAKVTDRQVRSLLRELIQAGEIEAVGTGRRGVTVYRVAVGGAPEAPATPEADFRTQEADFRPSTPEVSFQTQEVGFRGESATPEAGFLSPRKPTSHYPLKNHHRIKNNAQSEAHERKAIDADFEKFYAAYPRRVGRGQAAKAYRTARKLADADVLLAAAVAFAATKAGADEKFIPHPATWLNGERWLDQPAAPAIAPAARPRPQAGVGPGWN